MNAIALHHLNSSADPSQLSSHSAWHLTHLSKYTNCVANYSEEEQRRLTSDLHSVLILYHGWMALPLTLVALIFAVIYIVAVWTAVAHHLVSRKCYVLLLNRAIGDVSACIVTLSLIAYVLLARDPTRDVLQVLDVFVIGSFWAAMVSYVALSFLKLYAIARPLQYRILITMQRCLHLIMLSWCVFLLMTVYALVSTALVKIPSLSRWSGCKIETCLRPMYRLRNYLVITVYGVTLACFIATVMFVRRADKVGGVYQRRSTYCHSAPSKNDTDLCKNGSDTVVSATALGGKPRRFRFPLWKLAVNVSTFALLNLFYVGWAVGALWVSARDPCYFQLHSVTMWKLFGLVRITLMIRIAMDPVLAFFTDFQVLTALVQWMATRMRRKRYCFGLIKVRRSVLTMLHLLDVNLPFGLGISESGRACGKHSSEENSSDGPATGHYSLPTLTTSGNSQNGSATRLSVSSLRVLPNGGVSNTHRVHPAEKRRAVTQRRKDGR